MQLYESQIVQHAMDMSYVENDPMNDTQVVQAKSFDKYNFVDKTINELGECLVTLC